MLLFHNETIYFSRLPFLECGGKATEKKKTLFCGRTDLPSRVGRSVERLFVCLFFLFLVAKLTLKTQKF